MEGNACYKYYTIKGFLDAKNGPPIKTILEVGANVGNITLELAKCFPAARISAYEPVPVYFREAREKTKHLSNVAMKLAAITSAHLFADNFGKQRRSEPLNLHIYLGLPAAGPGYQGGSIIAQPGIVSESHREVAGKVTVLTLEEAMNELVGQEGTLDYLKTDSEGAECSFFGCASTDTLRRIRFISGEYHDLQRFWPVMQKLMVTHYVNIIGNRELGAFFCERRTVGETILQKTPMAPKHYPALSEEVLWWHVFREHWTPRDQLRAHGIASLTDTAFLVCGSISSGNRVLVSILARSGCRGTTSTDQPHKAEDIPAPDGTPFVMLAHRDISWWVHALKEKGYRRVVAIVLIREPIATISSAMSQGHDIPDFKAALLIRTKSIARTIAEISNCNAEMEILTYEGLDEEALKIWLPQIGLPYKSGPLQMDDQTVANAISIQNKKHYR